MNKLIRCLKSFLQLCVSMMDIFTRGANYIEMDINVHNFASLPKKALKTLIERLFVSRATKSSIIYVLCRYCLAASFYAFRFDQMSIDIGFCIESRDDGDMPETLFGCLNLHKPSIRWLLHCIHIAVVAVVCCCCCCCCCCWCCCCCCCW